MRKELDSRSLVTDQIRNLLLKEWDPIGIASVERAQDEYDSYVSGLYDLLMNKDASADEIASCLMNIENSQMGLAPSEYARQRCSRAAVALVKLRLASKGH